MEIDYEALMSGLQAAIPFNNHLGIKYVELGPGRGVAELPTAPHLMNHVGTQHAGGLFSVAEAASGGAFVAAFADLMGSIMPLAQAAEISYKKIAQGPIRAVATFSSDKEVLRKQLDEDGRIRFPVEVELQDAEGQIVAEVTVHWYVKKVA